MKPWEPPKPAEVIDLWNKADRYLLKERRDYWMNAEEAVTYGIVGKIIQRHDQLS